MAEKSQTLILNEMVESLNQAIGAASQLIHLAGNPVGFMTIREALELTKEGVVSLAPQNLIIAPKTVYV